MLGFFHGSGWFHAYMSHIVRMYGDGPFAVAVGGAVDMHGGAVVVDAEMGMPPLHPAVLGVALDAAVLIQEGHLPSRYVHH